MSNPVAGAGAGGGAGAGAGTGAGAGNGAPGNLDGGNGNLGDHMGSPSPSNVHVVPPAYTGGGIGSIGMVEKLQGAVNYATWKFSIRMALILEGLWGCVEGDLEDPQRDQRALARICLSLHPSLYQYVRDAQTSKEAWKKLRDIFEDKGLYRRVLLLRKLHKIEFNHFPNMTEYINNVMLLVQQLSDIGRTIDDAEVAELLLSGLPQEYDCGVWGSAVR